MPSNTDADQLSATIQKLWSFNDRERAEGIEQIRHSGQRAVKPLVSLLSDLVHDQQPRYATGKEEEGARVLQEYLVAVKKYVGDRSTGYDEVELLSERLSALAINSRLMDDVVDLLGELRAEQAVPILIEILNKRFGLGGLGGPEHNALCRIGEAAVPALIRDLDESTIRAYGFEPVQYGFVVAAGPAPDATPEADRVDQDEDDESLDRDAEKRQIDVIRGRVVWVLGGIGDPRSLDALQSLLNTTSDEILMSRLNEAITKIETTGPPTVGVRRFSPIPRAPR